MTIPEITVITLVCVLFAAGVESSAAVEFYVAKGGCDAWSGKLPAPNKAGADGPFATIEGARDAI